MIPQFCMNEQFFRRRWLDFRNGHSIYLSFVLTFINFILIAFNFAVAKLTLFHGVIDNLWVFALFFIAIYIPAAIIIGYWHRRNQYSVENEAMLRENWIWASVMRYEIRLIQGKTTAQENEQMVMYLEAILKRQKKDALMATDLPPVTEFRDLPEQGPRKNPS